jgi:hypothetical protein
MLLTYELFKNVNIINEKIENNYVDKDVIKIWLYNL